MYILSWDLFYCTSSFCCSIQTDLPKIAHWSLGMQEQNPSLTIYSERWVVIASTSWYLLLSAEEYVCNGWCFFVVLFTRLSRSGAVICSMLDSSTTALHSCLVCVAHNMQWILLHIDTCTQIWKSAMLRSRSWFFVTMKTLHLKNTTHIYIAASLRVHH